MAIRRAALKDLNRSVGYPTITFPSEMAANLDMETLIAGLRKGEKGYFSYRHHHPFIRLDFPRPEFYRQSFKSWGLDADDTLDWPEYIMK